VEEESLCVALGAGVSCCAKACATGGADTWAVEPTWHHAWSTTEVECLGVGLGSNSYLDLACSRALHLDNLRDVNETRRWQYGSYLMIRGSVIDRHEGCGTAGSGDIHREAVVTAHDDFRRRSEILVSVTVDAGPARNMQLHIAAPHKVLIGKESFIVAAAAERPRSRRNPRSRFLPIRIPDKIL